MEEKRINKNGLGLGLSVRREKFWHFSGILWLSRACTETKFPPSYQERWLILSHWLAWLLGPQVPTSRFSSHLSLTVAFPWLSLTLGPCLSLSSSGFASPLCGFRATTDKGILWLRSPTPTPTERMPTIVPQYQSSSPSHRPVCFVLFITSAKVSAAAKLCCVIKIL